MKVQVQITIDPTVLKNAREYIGYGNMSSTIEGLLVNEINKRKKRTANRGV